MHNFLRRGGRAFFLWLIGATLTISADDGIMPEWFDAPEINRLITATAIDELTDQYPLPPALSVDDAANEKDFTSTSTLPLSLESAVTQALERNLDLHVARLSPVASEQQIRIAKAAFDPTISLRAAYDLIDHNRHGDQHTDGTRVSAGGDISTYFPTGTTARLGGDWYDAFSESNRGTTNSANNNVSGTIGITQKLLRGRGLDINLISVEQARLDYEISKFQLQDAVEDTLTRVEDTYWNLVLARQRVIIRHDALKFARERLRETEERIRVGALAPMEMAQSRADVAMNYTNLIAARSSYNQSKLELLAMINSSVPHKFSTAVAVQEMPLTAPVVELDDIDLHIALGLRQRPDFNEARLRLRKNELTVKQTRNGLLPDLDLTIETGLGAGAERAGGRWQNNENFTVGGRVNFSHALGNRAERAAHRRAEISAEQAKISLENLQQQIEVNIRVNYLNVRRYEQQIISTALAAKQYEIALQAMREKFRVGAATSLDVAQAELNYTNSRLDAATAVIDTIKQLTLFYRADGSLLARRGINLHSR